jgi:hypothetical protein
MKTVDIKTYCEQLQTEINKQIEAIDLETTLKVSRASRYISLLSETIRKLKNFIHEYSFRSAAEEITFFKEHKPTLLSQYYYYERLFSIRLNESFIDVQSLRGYYFKQLNELQSFFEANAEFYRYCLSNSTELDDKYFTRSEDSLRSPEIDCKFSTGYDRTLARIIAFQLLSDYLKKEITNLNSDSSISSSNLKWTASKSALIELIYALQTVDSINGGKADIKQIADSFENMFNINLGNYYRHFQEIRLRKSGHTLFLDLMKEKFIQRMDELDEK